MLELQGVDVPAQADPDTIVVEDLNWQVLQGDRWLVTGGPGAGKSTVLQVAAGLIRPARGRHLLFGADVAELDERQLLERRSRIGMVFGAGGRLFTHLSVAENIALPLLYHARVDATEASWQGRLEQALEGLGLTAYARRRPRELPRRIAPRVALARALILRPEVLLLDDPVGGLGPEEGEWWCRFVSECTAGRGPLGKPPTTLVVAAADVQRWRPLANRSARVEDGRWWVDDAPTGSLDAGLRPAAAG